MNQWDNRFNHWLVLKTLVIKDSSWKVGESSHNELDNVGEALNEETLNVDYELKIKKGPM